VKNTNVMIAVTYCHL